MPLPDTLEAAEAGLRADLDAEGYAYRPAFGGDRAALLALARRFGALFPVNPFDPADPTLVTEPAPDAPRFAPHNRDERIGWHGDYVIKPARPLFTFAWIERADPAGPEAGAWRAASSRRVIARLEETPEGREALALLAARRWPLGFDNGSPMHEAPVVEPSLRLAGAMGLRYYRRALTDGAVRRFGAVPEELAFAMDALEAAADAVGVVLPCPAGALLVVDNQLALHDRLPQSVAGEALRRSVLCWVTP